MPYGELLVYQTLTDYNERFKFTGKERDDETGYDFFGARYYTSAASIWLSVDPLADKYPSISPYAYCAWNPMRYVDPDGRYFDEASEKVAQQIEIKCNNLLLETKNKNILKELNQTLTDIQDMRNDLEYEFSFENIGGILAQLEGITNNEPQILFGGTNNNGHKRINIFIDLNNFNGSSAHEIRHGGQTARREMFYDNSGGLYNYGVRKEVDAFRAQWAWDGGLILPLIDFTKKTNSLWYKAESYYDINKSFVNSIVTRVGSSEKLYPPQNYNKQLWKKN